MLHQLIMDVERFLENAESRTAGDYALALVLILVTGLTAMVLVERRRNKLR
jgi:hypothetical protein